MGWNVQISGLLRAGAGLLLVAALAIALAPEADAGLARQETNDGAAIRVVHGIANAGPLDVYVDGGIALIGIGFGDVSGDLTLDGGDHSFAVVPSGASAEAAIVEGGISLDAGTRSYAALLGTADDASVGLYAIDERPADAGRARFRVISGVADAGAITPAFAGGDAVSEPLGFGDASQYAAIDAGVYDFDMLDAATGGVLLSLPQSALAENTATDIILIGLVSGGTLQALVTPIALAAAPVEGLSARVFSGACDTLGPEVADLGVVQEGQGASVGVQGTPEVAQGFGLAPVSFTAMTDTPHVVAIVDSADGDRLPLACGAIGGALTDTGALVVALEAGIAGGTAGVAVLAPSLENPDATGVSIFLTGVSSGEAADAPVPVSEEDAG